MPNYLLLCVGVGCLGELRELKATVNRALDNEVVAEVREGVCICGSMWVHVRL